MTVCGPGRRAGAACIIQACALPAASASEQNVGALDVVLTAEELGRLDVVAPPGAAAGPRYPEATMQLLRR